MSARGALRFAPHGSIAALCLGIAGANAMRATLPVLALAAVVGCTVLLALPSPRPVMLVVTLVLAGWWWGSARLDTLDRSPLMLEVGRAGRLLAVVTGPARRGRYELRVPAVVQRFGELRLREPVLLVLELGRAPPQGARLEVLGRVQQPYGPRRGFDERTWLRRHGVHVLVRGDLWRVVGHRGGLNGLVDGLRSRLATSIATGVRGERRAVIEGVVLGDDGGLSRELRDRFRASGLYHLLAVSGQNVALVAGGVLLCAWVLGVPRWLGELGALAAIGAYVLAVGAQPSVVRAGIAGALGSLAWLSARATDRWYFLLLGALALLAWNPYVLLDAGFQLSFAAVAAIFVLVRPIRRELEGYPLPTRLADVLAVSTACGVATAPVLWLQFDAVPVLSVPANALAAPAVVPLLDLALLAAAIEPISPGGARILAGLNGLCAAYLAACARLIGGLPLAQVRSGWAAAGLAALLAAGGAYAWRRWSRS